MATVSGRHTERQLPGAAPPRRQASVRHTTSLTASRVRWTVTDTVRCPSRSSGPSKPSATLYAGPRPAGVAELLQEAAVLYAVRKPLPFNGNHASADLREIRQPHVAPLGSGPHVDEDRIGGSPQGGV